MTKPSGESGQVGRPDRPRPRAVFLDRDGVLVHSPVVGGKPVAVRRLEDLEILPDVPAGVGVLKKAGFKLVMVTNQPDVGNGLVGRQTVEAMHARLLSFLPLDSVKVCYHSQTAGCDCRKPAPGMLLEAAGELGLDLAASALIGDRWSDVAAGASAGCRTILLDRCYGEVYRGPQPNVRVASFEEACRAVLEPLRRGL